MCAVCLTEKIDTTMLNGKYKLVHQSQLYNKDHGVSSLTLCRMHDIELFQKGEKRFLTDHPKAFRRQGISGKQIEKGDSIFDDIFQI